MVRMKKYITGDYMECEIYNLPGKIKPMSRGKRIKESSPAQKKLNTKKARRYFVRLIHNNFSKEDLALDLTWDSQNLPQSREDVMRDLKNYIKRLNRIRKKEGLGKLKYVYVISNMDNMGNKKRYHVHMIINNMDRDQVEKKWGKGYANTDRLQFNETGITGKVLYLANQTKGNRSWGACIGLKKPIAIISDKKISQNIKTKMEQDPDDRKIFEKVLNQPKKHTWVFTDCFVEEEENQEEMFVAKTIPFSRGNSLFIRMRKYE